MTKEEIIKKEIEKGINMKNTIDIDPEYVKVVNDNFWGLFEDSDVIEGGEKAK